MAEEDGEHVGHGALGTQLLGGAGGEGGEQVGQLGEGAAKAAGVGDALAGEGAVLAGGELVAGIALQLAQQAGAHYPAEVAARFFGGNLMVAKHYMEQHWDQNQLDKSGFIHRLHALTDTLLALFATFGDLLKQLPLPARYVLASFPVAVCHNTRMPRCKLLTGKAYHGRYASKRSWFYGLKVQVVATSDGIPVEFYIHAGAESEQTGQRGLPLDLPAGSVLYTDAGYTDYVAEPIFNEASGG